MGAKNSENGLGLEERQNGKAREEMAGVVEHDPEEHHIPETFDQQELKGILESLLFVAHDPLTVDRLTSVVGGPPKAVVDQAIRSLQDEYDQDGRGLRISEVGGGFVMVTRADCAPWVKRLHKVKAAPKLSRSAIETLAIVAYKQPLVRSEIEQIRGVESSGVLRTLLDQKLMRIVGRKDVPGRPILYGTSKQFLERFGLRDLRDLPPLREFKELTGMDLSDLEPDGESTGENVEDFVAQISSHDEASTTDLPSSAL